MERQSTRAASLAGSAAHGFAITPSDEADLARTVRALFVGSGGALALTLASGAEVVFEGVAGGTILPVSASRVKATGTTAGAIVGLV